MADNVIGSGLPLPHARQVGRRIAAWADELAAGTRALLRTMTPKSRPPRPDSPRRRERFIEHAAMERELHRL